MIRKMRRMKNKDSISHICQRIDLNLNKEHEEMLAEMDACIASYKVNNEETKRRAIRSLINSGVLDENGNVKPRIVTRV